MRLEECVELLWFWRIPGKQKNGIPDYQLGVNYKGKDFALNFSKSLWDDCFDRNPSYRLVKEKENGGVCVLQHEGNQISKGATNKWLQNQNDFLDVIGLFLDSRIELGWGDWVYELGIRHVDDGRITVGYYPDDKVYNVGNFQIWENISNRWYLSNIARDPSNDSYKLSFKHSLDQQYLVYYKVSQKVLEKKLGLTLGDKIDFTEITEQFNKSSEMRLRFSVACDLINQNFKTDCFPASLTESNWDEFCLDPKGFVTSLFKVPV